MEELLNKLIQRWWKPFEWEYYDRFIIESNWDMCFRWKYPLASWESAFDYNYDYFKMRELVSKESWLWQFCVENKLVPIMSTEEWIKHYYKDIDDDNLVSWENIQPTTEYEYWLIECALKDEDKLEDFILSNVKINE